MTATVFLDDPMGDEAKIEGEEVKMIGDLAWIIPAEGDRERVVPLSNVTGVSGEVVEQEIDQIEFSGGRVTELVTYLS